MTTDSSSATQRFAQTLKSFVKHLFHRYRTLHIYGKAFIWLLILFYICIGISAIIITPARIAQFLYDKARSLAATPFGWLVLGGAIVIVSFPPLIGHTTLVSLCGFAYGMQGFFIASTASIIGSSLAFAVLRFFFSTRIHAWSRHNQKWQALESVVETKGLPLIILIRISPFPPWVYSNSLFASIEVVSLWQFVVATLFIFPKLVLHVFIGSRLAALSDGDQRSHMDTQTKLLNAMLVILGIALAIGASWSVYTLVQKQIRHLDGIPPEIDELAAEALEDYDEEAPLLRSPTSR